MIVSRLIGGLGNQMFEYAAGRALAFRHRTELQLDTTQFDIDPLRSYALQPFRIEASVLTREQSARLGLKAPAASKLGRLLERLGGAPRIPLVKEKRYEFDPQVLEAPPTCCLQGYWQSPKYFAAAEPQIRAELVVREPLGGENLAMSRLMGGCASVSLHVRRGDYVDNANTNRYHGVCGPEYYAAAEALLRERCGELRLFVFSDDPDWAQENLRFASPVTIVRHNGSQRDYEDLRLMSGCRHHVVANSTFSWWGAWLCPQADKIVVAPRNWFGEAAHSSADLVPDAWIRL